MSVYIAAERDDEALVVADIHNEHGKIVGARCYGWHLIDDVTDNGVDIREDWLSVNKPVCSKHVFSMKEATK